MGSGLETTRTSGDPCTKGLAERRAREQEFSESKDWFSFTVEQDLLDKEDFLGPNKHTREASEKLCFVERKYQDIHETIIRCLTEEDQKQPA